MRCAFLTLGFTATILIAYSNALISGISNEGTISGPTREMASGSEVLSGSEVFSGLIGGGAYRGGVKDKAVLERRSFLIRRKNGHAVHQRRFEEDEEEEEDEQ